MNSSSTPHITNHPRGHPTAFEQIITEKSRNFVGREFVFTAIHKFIHCYRQGYFTITGAPGSGKSAILAKYATDNPHVIYYNAELEGKNRTEEFIKNICTQLVEILNVELPEEMFHVTSLHQLIQQISDELQSNQKLIINIDGLDRIDRNSQSPGTNLFYLPRYLPDGVYFLLTRRPFLREKSGLLIETPSQSLNLADYSQETLQDIQTYIQQYLTHENLNSWLNHHNITEQEFCTSLAAKAESNFMYVSQVLSAMTEGFYPESLQFNQIPSSLETYYQQHWQKMIIVNQDEEFSQAVLNVLVKQQQPTSVEAVAEIMNADEFDVEEVLENWFEFLHQQEIAGEKYYNFYHSSFRKWLAEKI